MELAHIEYNGFQIILYTQASNICCNMSLILKHYFSAIQDHINCVCLFVEQKVCVERIVERCGVLI